MNEAIKIVLSPEQLEAVLSGKTIAEAVAMTERSPGGHTTASHMDIRDSEPPVHCATTGVPDYVSTFTDMEVAEEAVSGAFAVHRKFIQSTQSEGRPGIRRAITHDAGKAVGHGFARASTQRISMTTLRVVIDFQPYNGKPYYILTAFPVIQTQNEDFYHLAQLVSCYFNQDADTINDGENSIEGIIRLFTKVEHGWVLQDLIKETDNFILTHDGRLEEAFKESFGFDFSPKNWGTTAYEFLMTVRQIAAKEIELRVSSPDREKQAMRSRWFSKLHPLRLFRGRKRKHR